jgi:hypothetical protein
MPRRSLVTLALAVAAAGAAGCGSGGSGGAPHAATHAATPHAGARAAASEPRLFAPGSVWNAPLSADAPVDPSSPRLVGALVAEIKHEEAAQTGPWIETKLDTTPLYRVPADQPTVPVTLDTKAPWARTLSVALRAVPIPPNARAGAGTDGHLTIWQPSTDRLWDFWKAVKRRDGWHAMWGGAMQDVSGSPGYFTPQSWPGSRSFWGSTATSLPVIAGTILVRELQAGRIDHALALDIPSARADTYAWPAQRTDGLNPDPDSLPEGARLRLRPSLDIDGLYLPPAVEAIARAVQRYGMVVRDQTHHALGIYAEDPAPTGRNPYPALFGYQTPSALMATFPWADLEVLRMDLQHGTGRPQ